MSFFCHGIQLERDQLLTSLSIFLCKEAFNCTDKIMQLTSSTMIGIHNVLKYFYVF